MDKYAVVIDDEKVKTSAEHRQGSYSTCPDCGGKVTQPDEGVIPWCEHCGTKPFEKKPTNK